MSNVTDISTCLIPTADGIALRIKVVPGASRTKVAGVLGDRLKVAVAAPAEGGKANRAVCELIAEVMRVPGRDVAITEGQTQPRKTVMITGLSLCAAMETLKVIVPR